MRVLQCITQSTLRPDRPISSCLLILLLSFITLTQAAEGPTGTEGVKRPELIFQTGHTSAVARVAIDPDERWVATAGVDTLIKIWDREFGRELRTLSGHSGAIRALDRSNDGKFLASGSNDRSVRVWDVSTGTLIRSFETGKSSVETVTFSGDGGKLAAVGTSGFIKIWNLADGQLFRDLSIDGVNFTAAAFTPDGRSLAVAGSDSTIRSWDLEVTKKPQVYRSESEKMVTIAFSPDGSLLAAGGVGKKVSIWRTGNPKSVFTFLKHEGTILSAAFLSNSEVISVDSEHNVKFWDAFTGVEARDARKPPSDGYTKAQSAAIGRGGELTLYGYGNRTALLVNSRSGEPLRSFESRTVGYESVAVSGDGRWLAAGSRDKTVKLWDLRSGECLSPLAGSEGYVRAVVFHPKDPLLISGGIDGSIRIWDIVSGGEPKILGGHEGGVNSLAISSSGRFLITGGADGAVKVWDLASSKELKPLLGHSGPVNAVSISGDGTVAVSGGADKTVRVWDVVAGNQTAIIRHDATVRAVSISTDGKRVASGGLDGVVKLSSSAGALERDLANPGERILSIALSPDGDWVTAGMQDKSLKAWRAGDGTRAMLAEGHKGPVTSAFFEPRGKWLATASEDGSVNVWQTGTFARIATLLALSGGDDWLVVTPEGYFDGSPDAWRQLLWRFSGNSSDVSAVEVFFNEFYQPGLLGDLLQGRGLPDKLDIATKDRRQPRLELSADPIGKSDRSAKIKIKVSEVAGLPGRRGSGAKDVRLFRNGSLVRSWNYDVLSDSDGEAVLNATVPIVYGQNEFTAYAFNQDNVKSGDSTINITGPEALRREGVTHVIAIAVAENQNPGFNLKYIESDVNEFTDTFMRKQGEIGSKREVRVTRLLNGDATKEKILGTLRGPASKAAVGGEPDGQPSVIRPEDTVVVYFSGHGFTLGKRFYMVPHDLGTDASPADLAKVAGKSISDLELQEAFQQLDARNILLIIDACNSGQALESDEKRMGPMNNKGLAQFAYEKGMFVLTASQPDESAYVSAERKRSYLAYALIEEGLKMSKADIGPTDGRIFLREWFDYASRRVPEMRNEAIEKSLKNETIEKSKKDEQAKGLEVLRARPGVQRPRVFYRRQRDRQEMLIALSGQRAAIR